MNLFKKINLIMFFLLLSACRNVVDEGDVSVDEGMDPGVRQIVMEEEYEMPTQEEGMIPSPSDELRMD